MPDSIVLVLIAVVIFSVIAIMISLVNLYWVLADLRAVAYRILNTEKNVQTATEKAAGIERGEFGQVTIKGVLQ